MTTNTLKISTPAIGFYDVAEIEEPCFVPCWPTYANGDGYDCDSLLYGVMLDADRFQAINADLPAFDPKHYMFECPIHSGDYRLIFCG